MSDSDEVEEDEDKGDVSLIADEELEELKSEKKKRVKEHKFLWSDDGSNNDDGTDDEDVDVDLKSGRLEPKGRRVMRPVVFNDDNSDDDFKPTGRSVKAKRWTGVSRDAKNNRKMEPLRVNHKFLNFDTSSENEDGLPSPRKTPVAPSWTPKTPRSFPLPHESTSGSDIGCRASFEDSGRLVTPARKKDDATSSFYNSKKDDGISQPKNSEPIVISSDDDDDDTDKENRGQRAKTKIDLPTPEFPKIRPKSLEDATNRGTGLVDGELL